MSRYRAGAEQRLSAERSVIEERGAVERGGAIEEYGDVEGDGRTQLAARGRAVGGLPGWAVFASPEQMKDEYTAAKAERVSRRRRVRVARRSERGQLQSWRDIESLRD